MDLSPRSAGKEESRIDDAQVRCTKLVRKPIRTGVNAGALYPNHNRARVRTGVAAPDELVDVRGTLDRMRLVKDATEIATADAPVR